MTIWLGFQNSVTFVDSACVSFKIYGRAIRRLDVYGTGSVMNSYLIHCIEKFEAMNDVEAMANVIMTFVQG